MEQWSADQLLDAAQAAIDKDRFQDAVTVLGYLMQHYPATDQALKARAQYEFLTGTRFADHHPGQAANGQTKNGSAASDREYHAAAPVGEARPTDMDRSSIEVYKAALVGEPGEFAPTPSSAEEPAAAIPSTGAVGFDGEIPSGIKPERPPTEPPVASEQPPEQATRSAETNPAEAQPQTTGASDRLLGQLDEELQLTDRSGRLISHLLYGVGWLLLPIGVLAILFSWALGFSLQWGIIGLALAPLFIALGQTMRSVFDLRKLNEQLLSEVRRLSR